MIPSLTHHLSRNFGVQSQLDPKGGLLVFTLELQSWASSTGLGQTFLPIPTTLLNSRRLLRRVSINLAVQNSDHSTSPHCGSISFDATAPVLGSFNSSWTDLFASIHHIAQLAAVAEIYHLQQIPTAKSTFSTTQSIWLRFGRSKILQVRHTFHYTLILSDLLQLKQISRNLIISALGIAVTKAWYRE